VIPSGVIASGVMRRTIPPDPSVRVVDALSRAGCRDHHPPPWRLRVTSEGRDHQQGNSIFRRKIAIITVKICLFRRIAEKTSTNVRSRQIKARKLHEQSEGRDHQPGDCTNRRKTVIISQAAARAGGRQWTGGPFFPDRCTRRERAYLLDLVQNTTLEQPYSPRCLAHVAGFAHSPPANARAGSPYFS
jgi:hypothetical protein